VKEWKPEDFWVGEMWILPNPDGSPTREADPKALKWIVTNVSHDTITISTPPKEKP
jgi:hypothetical protein